VVSEQRLYQRLGCRHPRQSFEGGWVGSGLSHPTRPNVRKPALPR
jgi:hypothetical protein